MSKTSNVYIRVEPNVKDGAEAVLNELGLSMSNAVSIFLKQVVMHNGLPFEVKMPSKKPLVYEDLSEEDFDREILKAMDDLDNGRTYTVEEVEKELSKEFE